MHIENDFTRWRHSLGIKISNILLLIQFLYLHWPGCFSGIGQLYLLLSLTYSFARCTFGFSLAIQWVSSCLLRTRVPDIIRFITVLNTLVVKSLLVLRLRAIWNKDLIGKGAKNMCQWIHYIDFFRILVTLIVYFMTAGMFCRIWSLIDRDD